jgi:hypothetical protein
MALALFLRYKLEVFVGTVGVTLDGSRPLERMELVEIEPQGGKDNSDMLPWHRGHQDALLRSRAVGTPTRLCRVVTWRICPRMPWISSNKRGILDNPLLYGKPQRIELSLEFSPDRSVLAGSRQSLAEIPDRRKIMNSLGTAEEFAK